MSPFQFLRDGVAVVSVLALSLGFVVSAVAADNAAAGRSPEERIRQIAGRRDLRLTNDGKEGPQSFRFFITVSGPKLDPMTFAVERTPFGVALVGTSVKDQLVYCYATDGLVVKLDNARPGELLVARGANFSLVMEGDEQNGKNRFNVSLDAGARSRVVLDLPSTLRSLLPKVREIRENRKDRQITLIAENASVTVDVDDAAPDAARPTGLTLETAAGMKLRVHDIVVDPPAAAGSKVGLDVSAFADLALEKRVGPWTPEIAAAQAPVTPKDFWANDRNQNAGRLLAGAIDNEQQTRPPDNTAGATTAPSTQPKPMSIDPASLADQLGAAVRDTIEGQQAAVLKGNATAEQRDRLDQIVRLRKARLDELLQDVRAEKISRAEALRRAGELAVLTDEVKNILAPDQFLAYTKQWLSSAPPAAGNPIRRVLGQIAEAAAGLDLSDLQSGELARLLNDLDAKSEQLRQAYLLGEIDADGVKAITPAFTTQLIDGLKHILSADQYRQIEALLKSNVPKQPPPPPAGGSSA